MPRSERELRAATMSAEITPGELYTMREALEVPAAGWAAEKIAHEQHAGLRTVLDRMEKELAAGEPDFGELGSLDIEFHLGIASAADNRFLRQTSHVLYDILRSGMQTTLTTSGRPDVARRDHENIYRALARCDPAAARRAVRHHIRGAHAAAVHRVEERRASSSS